MLTKSIHRHLLHFSLVLGLIGVGFWYGAQGKAELKGEIKGIKSELSELRENAKKPKISVHNNVEDVKVKDGAQLHFVPDTEIQQINVSKVDWEDKSVLPVQNQIKILEKQKQLDKLKKKNKRKRKQSKLQEEIDQLKIPP